MEIDIIMVTASYVTARVAVLAGFALVLCQVLRRPGDPCRVASE